ncbi:MAG: ABC transporter substrate-binding protein [bacterium]
MYPQRAVLAGLCAAVVLAGCAGDSDPAADENPDDGPPDSSSLVDDATFRFPLAFDPGELDPAVNLGMGRQLQPFAYDFLVQSDGDGIVGNLANEWDASPERVEFTIKEDVTCSDGSDVTPSVIAESFEFYRSGEAQQHLFPDVSEWEVDGDDSAGTVTFTFGEPVAFPVDSLAYVPVICGEGLEDRSLLERETSGSGPYVLVESVPNDQYVFERRDDYTWGPGGATTAEAGLPATVELLVVPDPSTAVNMLLAGDLDGAGLPEAARERLGDDARALSVPSDLGQLMYNNADGRVTADADVRRALTAAVDREAMASVAKGELTHNMPFPLTNPCPDPSNADAIPAYDPEAAGQLLDDAGWEMGPDGVREKDGAPLTVESFTVDDFSAEFEAAATLATRAWRELGVEVDSRSLTGSAALQTIVSGEWDVAPMSSLGSLHPGELAGVVDGAAPPEGSNLARIDNQEYRDLVGEAIRAESAEEGCAAWNAAERALYTEANIIPVLVGNRYYAQNPNIEFDVNMAGVIPTSVRVHGE